MSNLNDRSIESIFREVIASDEESRARILQAIDPQKRQQVKELLELDAEADAQGLLQSLQANDAFSSRFPAGTILDDRYRVVSLIGHGGMGEVYRADDLKLDQTVALKFQPAKLRLDKSQDDQLRNEVRLARQVAHPHVCQVYDIGELEGQCFIAMEYIDGEDLNSLLRRIGRLSHDKAMEIAQQLCAGLSAAHANGVLHRDLKPANIMLDGNGKAHITDFGLAMISSDGPMTSDSSGTPAYMAPEQILEGTTSIQSDLYALGLILYEMFTGQRAYQHKTMRELRAMHQNASGPVKPSDVVDDVSATVDAAIRRCLESDPSGRPQSAASLANLLSAGDPLIAAMITDEVPSPELVATYGEPGMLSPRIAIALCGVLVAGMISLLSLCDRSRSVNLAQFDQPELLERDAKRYLTQFGYKRDGFDSARGFLGGEGDPAFWYRESPAALIGVQIPLEAMPANYGTIVNLLDPAWTTPGMLGMKIDPTSGGKLSWFRAIPVNTRIDGKVESEETPWNEWFSEEVIGFDLEHLSKASWRHTPIDACDRQMAWEGQLPGSNQKIYVEAMSYRDRPTWFRVMKENEFRTTDTAADQDHLLSMLQRYPSANNHECKTPWLQTYLQ